MPDILLWQQDPWRCELRFKAKETRLCLYDGAHLVFDEIVTAGVEAWQQANTWRTAICQVQKAKPA